MRALTRPDLVIGTIAALSAPVASQRYPAKAVGIVVPFGPGGPADVYARQLGKELTDLLKQQFVAETCVPVMFYILSCLSIISDDQRRPE